MTEQRDRLIYNPLLSLLMKKEEPARWEGENICKIDNVIRGFNWTRYVWRMVFIIPAIIFLFDICLFYRVIPEQFTVDYVILVYSSPKLSAMFLSNYAHITWSHLTENMLAYAITVLMIVAVAFVAIPHVNRKVGGNLRCRFGTKTLVQSTLVFFLIVPFMVSATSILAAPAIGMTTGVGFSGIGYAFEGYLVYICEMLIIRKSQVMWHRGDRIWVAYGTVLGILLIVLPIVFMNPLQGQSNYVAHLTGFVAGFMTPFLIERVKRRGKSSNMIKKSISSNGGI